jgi:hypothetical protein
VLESSCALNLQLLCFAAACCGVHCLVQAKGLLPPSKTCNILGDEPVSLAGASAWRESSVLVWFVEDMMSNCARR